MKHLPMLFIVLLLAVCVDRPEWVGEWLAEVVISYDEVMVGSFE